MRAIVASWQARRNRIGRLDLQLAEAADRAPTLKNRHSVIDDVRQQRVAIVAQQHTATGRWQAHLRAQLGVA